MDTQYTDNRGWYGFDLDGTIAKYDGWFGPEFIGEPIPLMIEMMKTFLEAGRQVKIVTARVCSTQPEGDAEKALHAIEAWCQEHLGQVVPVTAEKDWYMLKLYDDRCVQVEHNTGRLMLGDFENEQ